MSPGERGEGAREAVSERGKVGARRKVGRRGAQEQSQEMGGDASRRGGGGPTDRRSEGREDREESSILTSSLGPQRAWLLSAPGSPPLSRRATR